MSILNRFQLRVGFWAALVCGLWQSGATAAVIYPTVTQLYVATGTYASVTSYTDQSVFNAAVTGQVTRNFAALNGFYASPLDVSFSGYTISASATGGLYVGNPGGLFSTNNSVPLTFTFTGTLPTAVGGLFLMTDADFNAQSSALSVSLNDGTFINLPAPSALNLTGAFAGFTSNVGITSLTVGLPVPASVPEPSSFALMSVVGLLGLVYRKRMKK